MKTIQDPLSSAQGEIVLGGIVGKKLDACIQNGIMATDSTLYTEPYARKDDSEGSFCGEFWGKWFTSAALAYRYQPKEEYRRILDKAVDGLLASQEENGRLSCSATDFTIWDIWGRKYALLGLVAYYDATGSEKALTAASRALDQLMTVVGPGKQKLTETGLRALQALSSNSILEPIVLIYQRTGDKKYLDFAEYIVSEWSRPSAYNANGLRLLEDIKEGVLPINTASPKGYEQMSCMEGICELYRATGKAYYRDLALQYGEKILEREVMITGSASSGELWFDGAYRQTEMLETPMETCVTATWMKFCYQLLRLSGDPKWADELERSLYNALFGAMFADGSWWAYFSPLLGERVPSQIQLPQVKSSCCVVNGPRAAMITPLWALMQEENALVVNLYSEGRAAVTLKGDEVILNQKTAYPKGDTAEITIHLQREKRFVLKLRMPEWNLDGAVCINGKPTPYEPGTYLAVDREWRDGDTVSLRFDMRGRIVSAPGSVNHKAVVRGPVVLAMDSRLVEEKDYCLRLLDTDARWVEDTQIPATYVNLRPVDDPAPRYIDLEPCETDEEVWMAFRAPFLYRPVHFYNHRRETLVLCDYASAGNRFGKGNALRVWLPQPLMMNMVFPKNSFAVVGGQEETL